MTRGDVFLAFLAYFPILNLVPLARRRKDRFLLYHTRQGLYLFSVFLVLLALFLGLFYVSHNRLRLDAIDTVLAVFVLLTVVVYGVAAVWMAVGALQKKMIMLPVLGELAGER